MTSNDKFSKALDKFVNLNDLRFTSEKYEDVTKNNIVLYTRADITIVNKYHNDVLDISITYDGKDTVSSIYRKIASSYARALLVYN